MVPSTWARTSSTSVWELVRNAHLGPTPDLLNQKPWGWALTSLRVVLITLKSENHRPQRKLGSSCRRSGLSTILCLSTNMCIFPFPPVLLFTAIKTTTSFIWKSRFVFTLLIPKPCPASVWAGVVPYPLADWSLHTVTGRTSWSLAVQFSLSHTPLQAGRRASSPSSRCCSLLI